MFKDRTLIVLVLIALLVLPVPSIRAQDGGLPDEEQALLNQAVDGLVTANGYTSFESTADLHWAQVWTAITGGNAVQGNQFDFLRHEQTRTTAAPVVNIDQIVTADQTTTTLNQPSQHYVLESEVRLVDGTTYVKATYTDADAGAPEVPDGWYQINGVNDIETWPGLSYLINPGAYLNPNADVLSRLFGLSTGSVPDILAQYVTGARRGTDTLDDGTPVTVITLTVSRDGAMALQTLGLDLTQPVMKMIFDGITTDPLTLDVLLDESGQLVGLDYTLAVDLHGLDASWMANVPADLTLDITLNQTFSMRLTNINGALERVAAPQLSGPAVPAAYSAPQAGQAFWWNDRTFYEIFVRSFYDSNGDGIGDLRGVIEKLDYLNDGDPTTTTDLGVTGLWLMPIMESPSYHGYDVVDYFTVEQDYGTNQDFKDLMAAAHERGMVVIVDMVLNHTSTENPWFEASSAGDPQYADWYVWSETDLGTRSSSGGQTWYPAHGRYYYALFWSGMPDLNYNTPAVTEEVDQISKFWLDDMGADGFRLDAIRHLYEDFDAQPPVLQNAPATLQWLTSYHEFVKSLNPDALMVGEVWDSSANIAPYVGDKIDIAFEFDFAAAIIAAAQSGNADNLLRVQSTVLKTYPFEQYATFLTNHDQNRVMSQFVGNTGTAKVAASILLTNPGVPFIYYGEEIGMQGTKPDERIRTPMQWDDSKPAGGFSAVTPWEGMAIGYNRATVAGETDDPDSLLNHYRTLIHLRDEHPALRTGSIQLVTSTNKGVYSFLRYGEDETLLIVINLSKKKPVTDYALSAAEGLLGGVTQADLLFGDGTLSAPAITESGGFTDYVPLAELPPQSTYVIRLY